MHGKPLQYVYLSAPHINMDNTKDKINMIREYQKGGRSRITKVVSLWEQTKKKTRKIYKELD